ncbi:RNA polymerase sigma factor [Streptomyces mirabilis]|uniref:RNA polymerase sigma factor n=1 Tax=Streptomyces mirabilis TaxID=68239 RepID=UPI003723B97F
MGATGLDRKAFSMQLLLGLRPLKQPLSDAALMLAVRKGEVDSFRYLYRRHYAAIQAYAFQCMASPLHAQEVTAQVFAGLLQQALAGESLIERRYPGLLRTHLLGNVRTTATMSWHREPETLAPEFRDWVAAGSRWPWGEDGQLTVAFERLPLRAQRLLWHSMVERDTPTLISRITGLAPHATPAACEDAKDALREARMDLYLERLERQDCREAIRRLALRSGVPADEELEGHLRICRSCVSVYKDVVRLDTQFEAQLPVRLLGWWTGERYLRAKAAIPVPLGEPPFLARLLERAKPHTPTTPSGTPRATTVGDWMHRRGGRPSPLVAHNFLADVSAEPSDGPSAPPPTAPRRHRRKKRVFVPRSSGATIAAAGFMAGVGAGMLLLASCEGQGPAQSPSRTVSGVSHDPGVPPTPPVSTSPELWGVR